MQHHLFFIHAGYLSSNFTCKYIKSTVFLRSLFQMWPQRDKLKKACQTVKNYLEHRQRFALYLNENI